jgi:hypothetical protein
MKRLAAALAFLGLLLIPANGQQARGFTPCAAFTFSVTNSSANTQLSGCGANVVLINGTSTEVFYSVGTTNAVTATASAATTGSNTSFSLPANSTTTLTLSILPGNPGPFIAMIAGVAGPTLIRINQGWNTI